MIAKNLVPVMLLLTIWALVHGCGYRNPYSAPDGRDLPVAGIYLEIWENRTNELGLESKIRQALADWLIQSKHLRLRATAAEADYELTGILMSTDDSGTSYGVFDQVQTIKTAIRMSFSLKETKTGTVVWHVPDLFREAAFAVGPNPVLTRSNKQQALRTLASETAEDLYLRIFYTLTRKSN